MVRNHDRLISDYYEALERLKIDNPLRVQKGTKITNDAVRLKLVEGKGSIKGLVNIF